MAAEHPGQMLFEEIPEDLSIASMVWREIHVTFHANNLLYGVRHDSDEEDDFGKVEVTGGRAGITELLDQVATFLDKVSAISYRGLPARESQLQNLRGVGATLFVQLVPAALRDEIAAWPEDSWITISTNESWVPWELLYDGKGFLGERFLLFRLPRHPHPGRSVAKPLASGDAAPKRIPLRKVINVVGGDLKERAKTCEQLFEQIGQHGVLVRLLKEVCLEDLAREISDADLIHFTCHGHSKPFLRLQISRDDDFAVGLAINAIQLPTFGIKRGSLIFANACGSAASRPQFGDFLSFGWEFYIKGAGVFIGTLGTIPTNAALEFARAFYGALIDDEVGDVCVAYRRAKAVISTTSPMHLLYCLYGNPRRISQFNLQPTPGDAPHEPESGRDHIGPFDDRSNQGG